MRIQKKKWLKLKEMKIFDGIWLAEGETQSLRGDNVLQSTPKWDTMHCSALCIDQSALGEARFEKQAAKHTSNEIFSFK